MFLSSASVRNPEAPPRPPSQRPRLHGEPPKPLNLKTSAQSPPSSDEGEDCRGQPPSATIPPSVTPFEEPPALICVIPNTGSPNGKLFSSGSNNYNSSS